MLMRFGRLLAVVLLLLSGDTSAYTLVPSAPGSAKRCCGLNTQGRGLRTQGRIVAVSQDDAESDARLLEALFGSVEAAAAAIEDSDPSVPSHMKVERDPENGEPVQLRFVYVEEVDCIGCTYCASVARNTFFMEDTAGRARAFSQGTDEPDTIAEAIESCPVNCISFVDYEDLCILESEREGFTIDHRQAGMRHADPYLYNRRPDSKAKLNSGASLTTCNNCPTRGCKECPMYGVGRNPNYLARLEERELKRELSGKAAKQREEDERASLIGALFDERAGLPDADERAMPAAEDARGEGSEGRSVEESATAINEQPISINEQPIGVVEPTTIPEVRETGDGGGDADDQREAVEAEPVGVVEPTKLDDGSPAAAAVSVEEQFDVLFSGGYALPDLEELDD